MLRSLGLLSILSLLVFPGCASKECTLIGCASSFEAAFTGSTGKPGRYRVDVVTDGVPSTCEVTLPWTCDTQPTCSASNVPWKMTMSGCALGADGQRLDGIAFREHLPVSLEMMVRRDDVAVGEGSVNPQYAESRPNGPDCDPVCRSAPRLEIAIAP
jgi:hypothetical protein